MEQKILATLIQDRTAFEAVSNHINAKEFSPEGALILNQIKDFYVSDPSAVTVDVDLLTSALERRLSSAKQFKAVAGILRALPPTSGANVVKEILSLKAHNIGLRIASELASGRQNDLVRKLMTEYQDVLSRDELVTDSDEDEFTGMPVQELVTEHYNKANLIHLWPKSLNDHIDGGARPGHHVLIFAPTEMGKTLVTINMVAGFTQQKLKTLYVGNEDPAADLLMRYINRITGLNKYQVQENPKHAQELCDKRGYDLLTIAALAPGTFPRIHRLIEKYDPDVVVLDQLRNLDVESENRTQALEKAATEARNTAKRYGVLVVSVAQAADSASGKKILNRGDVDSSNVGIPGQVDLMIGLGADDEMESRNLRTLSFPKNKLSGRHEPLAVVIDPFLSKVIDAGDAPQVSN